MKKILLVVLLISSLTVMSQTGGTLSFTVTTQTYYGQFKPRHILAIWIADANGTWVKTRKFMSSNTSYRQFLSNFRAATNSTYNATDAITGATLNPHTTHQVSWDGKDKFGNLVADGVYRVYVEFTEANATGKLYYCEFTKGPSAQTLTPADQSYFKNISCQWTPDLSAINNQGSDAFKVVCFPNPFSSELNIAIDVRDAGPVLVGVYDITGREIKKFRGIGEPGKRLSFTWDTENDIPTPLPAGLYYIKVQSGRNNTTLKAMKTR